MNERTTNPTKRKNKKKKVQPTAEITDTKGMGARRKRHRDSREASNSSSNPLSMEEGFRERGADISERQKAVRIKDLEKEIQRLKETLVEQTKELMRVKKEMNLV